MIGDEIIIRIMYKWKGGNGVASGSSYIDCMGPCV